MTAAAADRRRRGPEYWKNIELTFASGDIGYAGTSVFLNPNTGKVGVVPGPGLIYVGQLHDGVDASSADKVCQIDMLDGMWLEWLPCGTAGDAIVATDVGKLAYHLDDQTLTINPLGKTLAGRIWKVDAIKGILFQKLPMIGSEVAAGTPAVASFTANDYAPATIINGAIYDVPTTAGVSTVTLPAAAPDGTVASFAADGVKNGHTVQYRDATGPVNLTTALVASKRHLVMVAKRDGKWIANAYVAP